MKLITTKQLAKELQLTEAVVLAKARAGVIPSYIIGDAKSRRYDLHEVLKACRYPQQDTPDWDADEEMGDE